MSNPHLGRPVHRWGAEPSRAGLVVLTLHGRDQEPAYMRAVADRIDLPDVHWVAPHADASSWYPLSFLAETGNQPRLGHALELVTATRADLEREGIGADRLALLGFSQGACVLTQHLVDTGDRCAAAALLTGGYVGPPGTTPSLGPDLAGMPVLVGSAAADALVPLWRVRESTELLTSMGAAVDLEVYDDQEHLVSDRAVASTRRLLGAATSGPSPSP